MNNARKLLIGGGMMLPLVAHAQVPDLLTALDVGGRSMGMGGSLNVTASDTLSTYYNPAGLGYVDRPQAMAVFRNFPESTTVVSGDFNDPTLASTARVGRNDLAHLGYATPLGRGAIGVSYTVGGFINDRRVGTGLPTGNLTVQNYQEQIRARSDFFTLAYGQSNAAQMLNWGAGLVVVRQGITNLQTGTLVDANNQTVSTLAVDNRETGNGIGAIVGFQFVPADRPNVVFGASYRTEMRLTGNSNTSGIYDRIPARLAAGFAARRDGLRAGNDFLLFAGEVQHFFRGGASPLLDRSRAQTVFGVGVEYNYAAGFGTLPLRLGYRSVPAGGDGFASRSGFTFGVGYRPNNSDLALDLGFLAPERGGGYDMSLSISYRFGG
jgi:hypothetical protein